jgi:hypothetical protein
MAIGIPRPVKRELVTSPASRFHKCNFVNLIGISATLVMESMHDFVIASPQANNILPTALIFFDILSYEQQHTHRS